MQKSAVFSPDASQNTISFSIASAMVARWTHIRTEALVSNFEFDGSSLSFETNKTPKVTRAITWGDNFVTDGKLKALSAWAQTVKDYALAEIEKMNKVVRNYEKKLRLLHSFSEMMSEIGTIDEINSNLMNGSPVKPYIDGAYDLLAKAEGGVSRFLKDIKNEQVDPMAQIYKNSGKFNEIAQLCSVICSDIDAVLSNKKFDDMKVLNRIIINLDEVDTIIYDADGFGFLDVKAYEITRLVHNQKIEIEDYLEEMKELVRTMDNLYMNFKSTVLSKNTIKVFCRNIWKFLNERAEFSDTEEIDE
ncbi:hypothetical protein EBZ39_19390, partial [bacterium]|nr:hypothetical protein [bacterium]